MRNTQRSEVISQLHQAREPVTAGIVHKISLENFLCHDHLEIEFNQHINFIIGKNGSGKSAILTALVVALGQKASATSRGNSIKDFIKTGRTRAVVKITLVNKGLGAYLRETYGDLITIERTITQTGSGGYKILNENGRTVSNKREDLNRILAKMNLQVDNPVCILNQETAKNFLHSNDPKSKYALFERATQMDQMTKGFASAEEEISRSKSCLKEKINNLEQLRNELKKWRDRNNWYEAIDEVNEKRSRLENMIAWAQIEAYEKQANAAQEMLEQQKANFDKLQSKKAELEQALTDLEENHRQYVDEVAVKVKEVHNVRTTLGTFEQEQLQLKNRLREIGLEIRQLDAECRRYNREKDQLMAAIAKVRNSGQDSEYAERKEKRLRDLQDLKRREEELNATRKVTEGHVDHLKSAVTQYKNEAQNIRLDLQRIQRDLDPKMRRLGELKNSGGNKMTVFGEWVPHLLARLDRMNFDEKPRGPAGAYIKVRDQSWAPVVEQILGRRRMSTFICSTDRDTSLLNRLLDELKMYDVSENRVVLSPDHQSRNIHCLMDMIEVEDPDVANMLIDLQSIETILLIANDHDARTLLSDRRSVPTNCRQAFTKECNVYFPDPNYKSYAGRSDGRARFLQVSVEETIRALEEEVDVLKQDQERIRSHLKRSSDQIQSNETECRTEENRLNNIRKEISSIRDQIRSLESQQEPEPTDVLEFEEDLALNETKLTKCQAQIEEKKGDYEHVNSELKQAKQQHESIRSKIAGLASDVEPAKDCIKQIEAKQRDCREKLKMYSIKEGTMKKRLEEFEADHKLARDKAEAEAKIAEQICPRMRVDKSLKALTTELNQIQEQLSNHEREFGTREQVLNEYLRRRSDYDRAKLEVNNSSRTLHKMMKMAKKRKDFIINFRRSIMVRTHYVFQALLRNRNFEGELQFDPDEKTLAIIVTPPGRNELGVNGPPNKRARSVAGSDIRTLSGGERSYATVCFIISLWDAIESPFRVLDEFDVFMDEVNRRVSMDLLIAEANENFKHQYIFLTPLGLELERNSNLSIFKMDDPDRRSGNF